MKKLKAVVFLGPPASGKGTMATLLSGKLSMPQFLPGVIYRKLREEDSELGKTVRDSLASGGYCPDELTNSIFTQELNRLEPENPPAVILDGYPRSNSQLCHLVEEVDVIAWVYLNSNSMVLKQMATARRECPACGRIFSALKPESHCQCVDSSEWKIRFDDSPEMYDQRYETYRRETLPIVNIVKQKYAADLIEINYLSQSSAPDMVQGFIEERLAAKTDRQESHQS